LLLGRRWRGIVTATEGAKAMYPDLTKLNDRQLDAHGDQAAFTWISERERVKREWERRSKPHMVHRQEEREREADRLNGRTSDPETGE
jgi:hypothetical protein